VERYEQKSGGLAPEAQDSEQVGGGPAACGAERLACFRNR
jgi:hypothetical protein